MSDLHHLRLSHARDFLRQAFAFNDGIDPQNFKPLGGADPTDPREAQLFRENMERCRQRAHSELAGFIAAGKLPVWGTQENGNLEIVAPDWAAEQYEKGSKTADRLYLTAKDFRDLWSAIVPQPARTGLAWETGIRPAISVASRDLIEAKHDAIEREYRNTSYVPEPCTWEDFDPAKLPELQSLHDAAKLDEWWTLPEAVAWIGTRDLRNVATLRYFAREWSSRSDGNATITLGALALMAAQFCKSGSESEAGLLNAIQRGQIGTSGRLGKGAVATDLNPSIWRGSALVYHDGEVVLVDAKHRLTPWAFDVAIRRKDLVATFPPEGPGGNVPANRKLDHDEIIGQAASMLADQPGISKGSAAASIVADLPHNPKTGKRRDTRHIERIISHLWEGGLSQSPR